MYQLPFGPGKELFQRGAFGKVAEGWELSGTGVWHTGHPLTVFMNLFESIPSGPFSGFSQNYLLPDGNDQTFQRPDIVPGIPLLNPGGGKYGTPMINAAAFQAPPVGANGFFTRFGNAGNGLFRALPTWQIDLSLRKETKLTERCSVEFAIEAFNIFNHVQLGDPNNLGLNYTPTSGNQRLFTTSPSFGVITSTVNFNGNNDNGASPNTLQACHVSFSLCFAFESEPGWTRQDQH